MSAEIVKPIREAESAYAAAMAAGRAFSARYRQAMAMLTK